MHVHVNMGMCVCMFAASRIKNYANPTGIF